jgi:hypothetical protein
MGVLEQAGIDIPTPIPIAALLKQDLVPRPRLASVVRWVDEIPLDCGDFAA